MFYSYKTRQVSVVAFTLLALLALAPSALAQGMVTVQVTEKEALGPFLTDGDGMTLYMFTRDTPNETNCYDDCAVAWPPLLAEAGSEPAAGSGVTGNLAVIERDDGTMQVTYNDMPLYYFANDSAPGDTNGQGVGDAWFVVHPDAPSVRVSDQPLEDDTVTIERVVAFEPGWLVVHADNEGAPGPVVGHSPVDPGENQAVVVQIDASQATPTLFAMLHVDRGELGTYEFPGDDGPVRLGGQVVTPAFQLTGMGGAAGEGTTQMLPETGGAPAVWPLALLAVGVLVLAGGLGLSLVRRLR